jgi:hypothetical protein
MRFSELALELCLRLTIPVRRVCFLDTFAANCEFRRYPLFLIADGLVPEIFALNPIHKMQGLTATQGPFAQLSDHAIVLEPVERDEC